MIATPVRLVRPDAPRIIMIDYTEANSRILAWHRHHGPVLRCEFALGLLYPDGELHGVATVERPKNRVLAARGWHEITRLATDGAPNACSRLYAACRREARARYGRGGRIVTYILASEPGTSLRAAGFVFDQRVRGRSWDTPARPRPRSTPNLDKERWSAAL